MAIAEDASTPAVATGTGTGTITTAAFSPPAGALLVALVGGGWSSTATMTATVSDSVSGSWTTGPTVANTNASDHGFVGVYFRYLSSAPGSMTVSAAFTGLSGGRLLAVRVLTGAASNQTGAGTGTLMNTTGSTTGTVSVTTTVAGSVVYGVADDSQTNSAYTVNAATSILSGGDFNDTTDTVRLVAWKATSATGTPGATTLGGTWAVAGISSTAALEILPFVATTYSGAATLTASTALTAFGQPSPRSILAAVTTLTATPYVPPVPQFPNAPRAVKIELYLNSNWADITSDVYARDDLVITRGRRDEQQATGEPQRCQLTINNRSGNYSPRNPTGIYYGSIGRNTPIRVTIELAQDSFSRSVSSGWGTSDTGHTYVLTGQGGTVANSDFNVSGGVGTLSVPAANAVRTAQVAGISLHDVDVSFRFMLPLVSVTGAPVAAVVILRDYGGTSHVYAAAAVQPNGSIVLQIHDAFDDSAIVPDTTIAGLTYSASQPLMFRVQAEGDTYRAKIWAATATEPFGWHVSGHSTAYPTGGAVSVEGWVQLGNTNTPPVVFSIDNLSVRSPRFFGEVGSWPQRWDTSGTDVYVPIEGSGITRRLSQGAAVLPSALYQALTTLAPPPVAYWPGEDGKYAGSIASAVPGAQSMAIVGQTDFAQFSDIAASFPLPTLKTGMWVGNVPAYVSTGATQVRFVLGMSSAVANGILMEVYTTGSVGYWTFGFGSTAPFDPVLTGYGSKGGTAVDTHQYFGDDHTVPQMVSLEFTESGGTINVGHRVVPVTGIDSGVGTYPVSGTFGVVTRVVVNPNGDVPGNSVGHINVRNTVTDLSEFASQVSANNTEPALYRMERIGPDNGITVEHVGLDYTTTPMGYQRPLSVLGTIEDCAAADLGLLFEPKGALGVAYRSRVSLYNNSPSLTLDYTAGQLAPPLEPVDDDQQTRNDITVTRADGASSRTQLLTGRMSVQDASAGGVGRYDVSYTANLATDPLTADLAGWLLNLGTVDEPRYPVVSVNLANPNVVAAGVQQQVLDLSMGDVLAITNPKTGQTPDIIKQLVVGYTETINVFRHTIQFNCVPESPYEVAGLDFVPPYFMAGDALSLVSGVSSSATSLSVNVGATPWVTGAASIPVVAAGETMTVTNITGVSSPQTWTVTRSTNGVVKSQSAGTGIALERYHNPILGM